MNLYRKNTFIQYIIYYFSECLTWLCTTEFPCYLQDHIPKKFGPANSKTNNVGPN